MSIQGVGRTESWTEFVKLVQEARTRSQGLGGGMSKSEGVRKSARLMGAANAQRQYGIMKSEQPLMTPALADLKTKIAGSFFDAYA